MVGCNQPVDLAAEYAIALAKQRGVTEVTVDDLLAGCLLAVARFGIVDLGPTVIDLDEIGLLWRELPGQITAPRGQKIAYSDEAVELFDRAARIARAELREHREPVPAPGVRICHLMAAFPFGESGLSGELQARFGITSKLWRTALARESRPASPASEDAPPAHAASPIAPRDREYLSPEDAAQTLGVHVQTVRTYVRSGKLPALRLAGERAIRIRREDLTRVLEPLQSEA